MSSNEGNENIKELLERVFVQFEKLNPGNRVMRNHIVEKYKEVAEELTKLLKTLPNDRTRSVMSYGKLPVIKAGQVYNAYLGTPKKLKNYLWLAVQEYLLDTNHEVAHEENSRITGIPTSSHPVEKLDIESLNPLKDNPDISTVSGEGFTKEPVTDNADKIKSNSPNDTNSGTTASPDSHKREDTIEENADVSQLTKELNPQQVKETKKEPQNDLVGTVSIGESKNMPIDTGKERIKKYKTADENIGIIVLIVASTLGILLVLICKQLNYNTSILTEILNILVLFSFFVVIQSRKLILRKQSSIGMLAKELNITEAAAKFNIERVNKTIVQLCDNIRWFIIFLLVFYFLNFMEDKNLNGILDLYDKNHLITDYIENLFNIISAAFIYFGFKVLYDITLDEENNTQSYFMGTLLLLLIFIISYSLFLFLESGNTKSQHDVTNYFNLACGIYNGLAMFLLFSRLLSMEFYFKDIKPSKNAFSKEFFHYGSISILPFYTLANCLYGVQELTVFPNLKTLIFLVCFIGKGFFLLFIYHYINFKWLHIYLLMILSKKRTPTDILGLIDEEGR